LSNEATGDFKILVNDGARDNWVECEIAVNYEFDEIAVKPDNNDGRHRNGRLADASARPSSPTHMSNVSTMGCQKALQRRLDGCAIDDNKGPITTPISFGNWRYGQRRIRHFKGREMQVRDGTRPAKRVRSGNSREHRKPERKEKKPPLDSPEG